jgi:RimJ/RimL family protein N-acetyltransferase
MRHDGVCLGPLLEGHLELLMAWRNDLRDVFRQFETLNMVNQVDWFERVSRDNQNYMYEIKDDDVTIGVCGLTHTNWKDRHSEVSIYIGRPEYRGLGLGKTVLQLLIQEAFEAFGLHRLYAEIYSFNERSVHLFESCGFELEGRMREAVWSGGQWRDALIYGLLAEEVLHD